MRRYESREARFSNRILLAWATTSLPETLAVVAAAGEAPAEILLYDEIGFWGVTAKDFALALAKAGDGPLTVRINSPGGDVFDGLAIMNALKARAAPVAVVVDGLAASAASFIAMAGTTVTMAERSMMMIHNAWGIVIGDRNEMLDTASVMEKIDGQMAAIYSAKCGKPVDEIAALLDAETWFTADEAKAAGLCDAVAKVDPAKVGAAARVGESATAKLHLAAAAAAKSRAAYDPDGDGDDDAAEAVALIGAAIAQLGEAIETLSSTTPDDDADEAGAPGQPIVPGAAADLEIAARRRRLRLAEADAS